MRRDRIRLLVDNASLDSILRWSRDDHSRFCSAVDSRRLVVYLAPETAAEMLCIGATSRAGQLQSFASLMLRILNGRVLNY